MYFSLVRGFQAIAVGSENIAIGMNSVGNIYSQYNFKGSGEHWHMLNRVPGKGIPKHIDCAADGTIGALGADGNLYLYDGGPRKADGNWNAIEADLDGDTISSMSIGGINNIVILTNKGSVYRYYANGLSKKIYAPNSIPQNSQAYLVGTSTDGTTVARFSMQTGINKQDIHQYFEPAGWANITPGDHDDILSLSPSDANTIYFAVGKQGLYKAIGNGVVQDVPTRVAFYNEKAFKYERAYLKGNIVSVNAGTDNRVGIVIESYGKPFCYLSTPIPAYGHMMPEMDIPEDRVIPGGNGDDK